MEQLVEVQLDSGKIIYMEVSAPPSDVWQEFSAQSTIRKRLSELIGDARETVIDISERFMDLPSKPNEVKIELAFEVKFGGTLALVNGETKGAIKVTIAWRC